MSLVVGGIVHHVDENCFLQSMIARIKILSGSTTKIHDVLAANDLGLPAVASLKPQSKERARFSTCFPVRSRDRLWPVGRHGGRRGQREPAAPVLLFVLVFLLDLSRSLRHRRMLARSGRIDRRWHGLLGCRNSLLRRRRDDLLTARTDRHGWPWSRKRTVRRVW